MGLMAIKAIEKKLKSIETGELDKQLEDMDNEWEKTKDLLKEAIKETVAKNKNTPVETLTKLAKDEAWNVRETVAGNKNTPLEILAKLAKDENEWVRKAARHNPNYKDVELESYLAEQNAYGNDCGPISEAAKDEADKSQSNNEIGDNEEPEIS